MSSSKSKYPLYIPNRSSQLRVTSAKKKLSKNSRRSLIPSPRRVFSAPGVRRSAKTNNRNVLELFKPENYEKIQMHYGEKPKSPDCSKLNETIQTKESEIKELGKKLKHAKIKCAAEMGDKVGKEVAKILSSIRKVNPSNVNQNVGGTRRYKNNSKNSKRRTQNRKR